MITRDEILAIVGEAMGGEFERMQTELESKLAGLVAAKPLPPFVPPMPWDYRGTLHPAGLVVRHRNGLFMARRDTTDQPPSEAWLPLLVGLASVAVDWPDDRTLAIRLELSDGTVVEHRKEFAVPIVRGFWEPERTYRPGDRVIHKGEFEATTESIGIDPQSDEGCKTWLKVSSAKLKPLDLVLSKDGDMQHGGHVIGTIKPLVADLFKALVAERQK